MKWILALILLPLAALGQVTNTPNIGLQIPPYGSSNWNQPLNYNFQQLDLLLSGNQALPGLSVTGQAVLPDLTTWKPTTTYSSGNIVFYQGVAFTSLVNGNVNNVPSTGSFWSQSITGSIPNTALVLKGGGAVGIAVPAVPNTDYLNPAYWATLTGCTTNGNVFAPATSNCVAQSGGAVLPSTGIVFANNTTTGVTATSAQIVAGINTSPSTLLSPSVLPEATGSTFGTVKPDGTTITISSGVISSVGGAGNPAGSNTEVQINESGSFGVDPTFTYDYTGHTLTTLNTHMQAEDVASLGNNKGSGLWSIESNVCTGTGPCNPVSVFYDKQIDVGTGANPYTVLNNYCATTGSSTCLEQVAYPVDLETGSLTAIADAQYFRAYGDALQLADGCNTTASSTTVYCPDAPFTSTAVDAGKLMCVRGAGAAGVGYCPAIVTVTDSSHVVVNAAAGTSVTQSPQNAVYGHDDTQQIQACLQYSASNAIECRLKPQPEPVGQAGLVGFLVASNSLQLVSDNGDLEGSASSLAGGAAYGTNLFCEYNGDCLTNAAGPIQGASVTNITLEGDQSQPNGRGLHLAALAGTYGNGGVWFSTFTNMQVNNFAKECLWIDSGGGPSYNYLLPNQVDTWINFTCNGPNQSHPAIMILSTGVSAQMLFLNGQINGAGAYTSSGVANYPNPLIAIKEKTSGQGDAGSDTKFFGYTYEVGTQGLYVGEGAYSVHFDNGYMENVSSPLIVNAGTDGVEGLTFNGNHIANSGNVGGIAQITGSLPNGVVSGGMRDNFEFGGFVTVTTLAACSGTGINMDFGGNWINGSAPTTTGCVTTTSFPDANVLTVNGGTTVNLTAGDSTPIETIAANGLNPGKTLTIRATVSGLSIASGGNIALGNYTSPVSLPNGGTATFTLLDNGVTWLLTDAPSGSSGVTGTTALATSAISSGTCQAVTAGSVNSSAATGATTASRIVWNSAVSLQTVTGYQVSTSGALSIDAYPTSGFVNFNICNWAASTITPGALTLNWKVE